MAYTHALSTVRPSTMTCMDQLEHSIAECEALLASMQETRNPVADRNKYLLGVRLSNIRRQLAEIAGSAGH